MNKSSLLIGLFSTIWCLAFYTGYPDTVNVNSNDVKIMTTTNINKPVLGYLLSSNDDMQKLADKINLSHIQKNKIYTIVTNEMQTLKCIYNKSSIIINNDKLPLKEKRDMISKYKYNKKVNDVITQSIGMIRDILSEKQYEIFVEWINAKFRIERNMSIKRKGEIVIKPNAISFEVYATQYNGDTDYEVSLPDRYLKYANRGPGWPETPSGYSRNENYSVSIERLDNSVDNVEIWDCGPWNIDDNYWNPSPPSDHPRPRRKFYDLSIGMPESEAAYYNNYNEGKDQYGRIVSNPAGIDLAPAVASQLGLDYLENDYVKVTYSWETQTSSTFNIGEYIEATSTLNVRSTPGGSWKDQVSGGDRGVIVSGAEGANYNGTNYVWYEVKWDSGIQGWSIEDGLIKATQQIPNPPTHRSPLKNSTIDTTTPTIEWERVTNADGYALYISEPPYGSQNIVFNSYQYLGDYTEQTSLTIPSGTLENGVKYYWNMISANNAGESSYSDSWSFTVSVDSTPPSVQISNPSDGQQVTSGTITVSGNATDTASGVASVQVRVNGGNWQTANGTTSWNITITLSEGENSIDVRSTDNSGNTSSIKQVTVMRDTQEPTVQISNPSDGQQVTSGTITVSGNATDTASGVASVQVRINGGNWQTANGTTSWNITVTLNEGDNNIEVRSTDNRGNTSSIGQVTVVRDTQVPTVQISNPSDGQQVTSETITVSGNATDTASGVASVQVRVNGGSWKTANGTTSWNISITLNEGDNNIEVRSTDNSGNTSSIKQVTVVRDTQEPTVQISNPSDGQQVTSETITVSGNATDTASGVASVQVRINGGSWQTANGTTSWNKSVTLNEGDNNIEVRSTDNRGNTSSIGQVTV
ncbi:MAG: hypothetical protein K9N48_03710, partial [Verrucomicrobia bacterium]|nr:hypothetical protein [Verrucomicrobiota bacterium]